MPSEEIMFQAWEEENKRAEDEYYESLEAGEISLPDEVMNRLPEDDDSENDEDLGKGSFTPTRKTKTYNTTVKDEFDSFDDIQSPLNPFPEDEIGVTAEDPFHTVQKRVQ